MFQVTTVSETATMAMRVNAPNVINFSLMTTKVKRGSSSQNAIRRGIKHMTRERIKHLYTIINLALIVKQGFLPAITSL
jgi:hypothetical protein